MDSLPTGSNLVLEIRTSIVDIVIKSKGKQTTAVEITAQPSSLKVVGLDVEVIKTGEQDLSPNHVENGVFSGTYDVSPLFFEQSDYVVTIHAKNGEKLKFESNNGLVTDSISPVLDNDDTLLSGVVNYGNNVGFSDFEIFANDRNVLSVRIEVYPTKISYRDDYRAMMADINDMVNEAVLDFMEKTYQVFVPDHKRNEIPAVFFTILQAVYDKYIQSVKRIVAVPHHKLITEHEVVPFYKAKRTDRKSEKWLQKHPEYVIKSGEALLADRVLAVQKRITYDTQENRLVKFMLKATVRRIDDFSARYKESTKSPDDSILIGAKKMSKEIRRFLSTTFLADVADYDAANSMSLVFGMAPGYRELYKYYLMLQNGFTVGGDIFHMSVRETAQLYEYWCFIKLYSILRDHYTLKSPDIIKVNRKGVTVDLEKGKQSKVTFVNSKTGESIYLAYNPSESKTQTVNQKPDNVLEIEKKGSKTSFKYVFDAKYRIEMNPDSAFYPDENPGPKVDDINTMHRYRDSIVYENNESRFTFEKTMFGAYILFPYGDEKKYSTEPHTEKHDGVVKTVYGHRFFRSIDSVNIGGLPFLPSATSLVTNLLETLISDTTESAFERATLPIGIENRLKTVEWDKRDVLIGFVPDKEHLDLCLKNGIYFTRRFDKNKLPIRYIALYEKSTGINYYGELVSWYQADRSTLPGKSSHAGIYHVFKVLKWVKLETLIKTEETGPNPIAYTNYFLLSTGSSYSELRLRTEEEYRLFIELKRRFNTQVVEENGDNVAFVSGDIKVMTTGDKIIVTKDGNSIQACALEDFRKKPNATFRVLMSYLDGMSV